MSDSKVKNNLSSVISLSSLIPLISGDDESSESAAEVFIKWVKSENMKMSITEFLAMCKLKTQENCKGIINAIRFFLNIQDDNEIMSSIISDIYNNNKELFEPEVIANVIVHLRKDTPLNEEWYDSFNESGKKALNQQNLSIFSEIHIIIIYLFSIHSEEGVDYNNLWSNMCPEFNKEDITWRSLVKNN